MKAIFTLVVPFLLVSCTTLDDMKGLSSGHIGCTPDEISISDQTSTSVTNNWIATCKKRVYVCNQDFSGYNPTVTCAERN